MGSGRKAKSTFESFVQLKQVLPSTDDCKPLDTIPNEDIASFVERIYKMHDWNHLVNQDLVKFQEERIDDVRHFAAAYLRGYLYLSGLSLISLDVLAFELDLVKKAQFKEIPDTIDLANLLTIQELRDARLNSAEVLRKISKKGWKKCKIPAGVKVKVEEYLYKAPPTLLIDRMEIVGTNGVTYECDRYCPHKGADMLGARVEEGFLICPRHQWKFDLEKGGVCVNGKFPCTVNARRSLNW